MSADNRAVAIIGTGMIGQSWALAFARSGFAVRMFDHVSGAGAEGLNGLRKIAESLEASDLLGGRTTDQVVALCSAPATLAQAVDGVCLVQENTPENPVIKKQIFAELDAAVADGVPIASSTSALLPSVFSEGLAGAGRCLVAHPLNPPHLVPAVEIVPGPQTTDDAILRVVALMSEIGQSPIVARKEIDGFILNRLQGALLDEAFSLIDKGITTVDDIDTAIKHGLARRWVFIGPFETLDLNAPGGIAEFIERYGDAYRQIGTDRPARPAWEGALRDTVIAGMRERRHIDELPARRAWRDSRLADLAVLLEKWRGEA